MTALENVGSLACVAHLRRHQYNAANRQGTWEDADKAKQAYADAARELADAIEALSEEEAGVIRVERSSLEP